MFPSSAPPQSPSVTSQQGSPQTSATAQFAQGMGNQQNAAGSGAGSLDYIAAKLKEIEMALTEVAQVLSVEMPQAMPFVQIMAQAGAQLSNTVVSQGASGQGAPAGEQSGAGGGQASMMTA